RRACRSRPAPVPPGRCSARWWRRWRGSRHRDVHARTAAAEYPAWTHPTVRAAGRNADGYYREMATATQTAPQCSRRRGEVLERALYEATLAELSEVGYGGLTMEGIAARAQTGKAALYRRWTSKHDLVHAALVFALPSVAEPRSGRSARDSLLTIFTSHR